MAASNRIRAALSALRHAPELQRRVAAIEAENRLLRQRIDDTLAMVTALRDAERRRLVDEAQRSHQPGERWPHPSP